MCIRKNNEKRDTRVRTYRLGVMARTSRSRRSTSTTIVDLAALALNPPCDRLKHLMDRLLQCVSMKLLLNSGTSAKDRLLEVLVFS